MKKLTKKNSISNPDTILVSTYHKENLFFAVGISPLSEKIVRIFLPVSTKEKLFEEISIEFNDFKLTDKYQSMARDMFKIYNGQKVSFDQENLELSSNKSAPIKGPVENKFDLKVLQLVLKIPQGEVRTYKEVAESMDSRAWRAVGSAMARNPFPLAIPCHRVVKSDLSLGKYGGGVEMKKELLKKEGVKIEGHLVKRP